MFNWVVKVVPQPPGADEDKNPAAVRQHITPQFDPTSTVNFLSDVFLSLFSISHRRTPPKAKVLRTFPYDLHNDHNRSNYFTKY